jgi:hypothetical protein
MPVLQRIRRLLAAAGRPLDQGPLLRFSLALLAVAVVVVLGVAAWLTQREVPVEERDACAVSAHAEPQAGKEIAVSGQVRPRELRPGDRYEMVFKLTNPGSEPVSVKSISMDTFQGGKLLRSTPGWFNASRHKGLFRDKPVPPGARDCIIYLGRDRYNKETGCGELTFRYTFHTSAGDFIGQGAWHASCE